jgi:Pentapeptide repeats (8 copies)
MIRFGVLGLIVGCVVVALLAVFDVTPWWSSVVAGAFLGAVLLVNAVWWIPLRQARRFRGEATDKELFDIENEARRTLVQLVRGLAIVATIALTLYQTNETRQAANRNLRLTAQGQISQRFAQAIDQLKASAGGRKSLAPRIGGIYTLAQMGADGEVDANSVASVLSAYVREAAPARGEGGSPKASSGAFSSCAGNNLFYPARADVVAALRGLSSIRHRFRVSIDLAGTDLSGAALRSVDLRSANLRNAVLVDADLQNADLQKAVLVETNLQGACLNGADLADTQATEATFDRAHLRGADIHRACLKGAYLYHFKAQQLAQACVLEEDVPTADQAAVERVCKSISCVYSSS